MRTIFSNEEMDKLKHNPCVASCTDRSIVYTYEFKKRVLELHRDGVNSKEIWKRSGFDISKWSKDYCKDTIKDWRQIVKKRGFEGLSRLQGTGATGRPKTKGVTDDDKIKRLELQVRYLKAENDFLAKLRAKKSE